MGLENAIYTLDKIRWFYNMSMAQTNNNEISSKKLTIFFVEITIQILKENHCFEDSILDWEMALKSIDEII
jgi:hypothetical protein